MIIKKFIYEGSLTKNDDTKETLNENAPGYDTRKFGEALPTLESVKAAYEDGNAKEKDLEDDSYEVDGSSVGDGKYEDDESRMQAKEKVKETDIPNNAQIRVRIGNELKDASVEDLMFYLEWINDNPNMPSDLDIEYMFRDHLDEDFSREKSKTNWKDPDWYKDTFADFNKEQLKVVDDLIKKAKKQKGAMDRVAQMARSKTFKGRIQKIMDKGYKPDYRPDND